MKKPLIVLAERDGGQRSHLHAYLRSERFDVIEAQNANGVFRTFRQHRHPDLLIVNASLDATRDGLDLARRLRCGNTRFPIIVLAPHSSEELAIAALKAGMTDYVKLPVSREDFLASVRHCLFAWCREPQRIPEPSSSLPIN